MKIEQFIRDNMPQVLEHFANVLGSTELPKECYHEALVASKAWCHFSTATFVPNQRFISQIFSLLQSDYFAKAVNVLKKLLVVSKFTKALQN